MVVAPKRFCAIDIEGNGAFPPDIVEIAIVEIRDFVLTGDLRHWLVRPAAPIQPIATRIHGLSDSDVATAPSIQDLRAEILEFVGDSGVVGHNVKTDLDAMCRAIPGWKPASALDTLRLSKLLHPGLSSYGLDKIGAAIGCSDDARRLTGKRHHSALYDAVLAALIFVKLVSRLSNEHRREALLRSSIENGRQGSLF